MSIVEDRLWNSELGRRKWEIGSGKSECGSGNYSIADCGMVNQGAEKRYRKWEGKYAEVEKDE